MGHEEAWFEAAERGFPPAHIHLIMPCSGLFSTLLPFSQCKLLPWRWPFLVVCRRSVGFWSSPLLTKGYFTITEVFHGNHTAENHSPRNNVRVIESIKARFPLQEHMQPCVLINHCSFCSALIFLFLSCSTINTSSYTLDTQTILTATRCLNRWTFVRFMTNFLKRRVV